MLKIVLKPSGLLAIKSRILYNETMFNTQHILYMVISGLLTAILLALAAKFAQNDATKNRILKISAVVTVLIHYSNLWVDYFTTGGAAVEANQILPVYPCNVVMWMLLAVSLMPNKSGVVFRVLSDFCFYGGSVCAALGIILNANYGANPTLADYDIFKGLLSHSTMLFGCVYLFTGGYIKVGIFNLVSMLSGIAVFAVCGVGINALHDWFGLEAPDGMWLRSNPYIPFPPMILAVAVVLVLLVFFSLREKRSKSRSS